jgi:hypothetical protein
MVFTALDALREDYEVYPVVDAIGGTSLEAHWSSLKPIAPGANGWRSRTAASECVRAGGWIVGVGEDMRGPPEYGRLMGIPAPRRLPRDRARCAVEKTARCNARAARRAARAAARARPC